MVIKFNIQFNSFHFISIHFNSFQFISYILYFIYFLHYILINLYLICIINNNYNVRMVIIVRGYQYMNDMWKQFIFCHQIMVNIYHNVV